MKAQSTIQAAIRPTDGRGRLVVGCGAPLVVSALRLAVNVDMVAALRQVRLPAAQPLVLGERDESQDDEEDD